MYKFYLLEMYVFEKISNFQDYYLNLFYCMHVNAAQGIILILIKNWHILTTIYQ